MKKYLIFLAALSILSFGYYFLDKYAIQADYFEYVVPHSHFMYQTPTVGLHYNMKITVIPNKLTVVADGDDSISLQIGQYFASGCTADTGYQCDSCWDGASLDNPKPACSMTESGACGSIMAIPIKPFLVDYNQDSSHYLDQAWDANDISNLSVSGDTMEPFSSYSCQNGISIFSLKSTTTGKRKVVLAEYSKPNTMAPTYYYPRYMMEVEFTAPPAPTCTDGKKNGSETGVDCGGSCSACAVTPPANNNTNSVTPTANTNVNSSNQTTPTSINPNIANSFKTTKATGQIIKKANNPTTVSLPATFSIEIGTINNKKPADFQITPLTTDDTIAISGTSNLPETKLAFEIQSDPILKAETTTDKQGAWTFEIPQKLSENTHTIYVTALDKDGQAISEKTKLTEFGVIQKREFTLEVDSGQKNKSFFAKYGGKIILGIGILALLTFIGLIIQRIVKSRSELY